MRAPFAPIRVLHVLSSLQVGGAELRTLEIIRATRDDGVESAICATNSVSGALEKQFREAVQTVYHARVKSILFPFRFYNQLRTFQPNAVHSHIYYTSALVLFVAWVARVPVRIANFHTDLKPKRFSIKHRLLKWLLAIFATDIVGVSPQALHVHTPPISAANPVRLHLIANGIDVKSFRPSVNPPHIAEFESIANTHSTILHVGRGDLPSKNREGALDILAACNDLGLPVFLVFVGRDGTSEQESDSRRRTLLERARFLGVERLVIFLGERHDLPDLLRSSRVLLMTSTLEGLPGVVVEAIAAGVPVVATDLPGVRHIARTSSLVLTVKPGVSPTEWVEPVREALEIDVGYEARVNRNARLRLGEFDTDAIKQRYLRLWSEELETDHEDPKK